MANKVKVAEPAAPRTRVLNALGTLFPGFRLISEPAPAPGTWAVRATGPGGRPVLRLLAAFRSVGEPRYLAQAITVLSLAAKRAPRRHPIVAAPYIAPEGQRLCREAEVGYLDLAGNAFLRFGGILVDRRTGDRPRAQRARLRRLFSPKSSRIARALLEQPAASWTLAGLAKEVGVSVRTAHLVVNALEEKAFVEKARGAIRLRQPGDLLDLWAGEYSLDQHERHTFYSFVRNPRELARLLAARAAARHERVALTLHAGAQLVAPFVRSADVHAYVVGDVDGLARDLDLRPAEAGAGVHLLIPNDEGVLYRTQTVDGLPVVCNTQLYLDLVKFPGRGREQADELRRQRMGF